MQYWFILSLSSLISTIVQHGHRKEQYSIKSKPQFPSFQPLSFPLIVRLSARVWAGSGMVISRSSLSDSESELVFRSRPSLLEFRPSWLELEGTFLRAGPGLGGLIILLVDLMPDTLLLRGWYSEGSSGDLIWFDFTRGNHYTCVKVAFGLFWSRSVRPCRNISPL